MIFLRPVWLPLMESICNIQGTLEDSFLSSSAPKNKNENENHNYKMTLVEWSKKIHTETLASESRYFSRMTNNKQTPVQTVVWGHNSN